jgi:hypothetical protein
MVHKKVAKRPEEPHQVPPTQLLPEEIVENAVASLRAPSVMQPLGMPTKPRHWSPIFWVLAMSVYFTTLGDGSPLAMIG